MTEPEEPNDPPLPPPPPPIPEHDSHEMDPASLETYDTIGAEERSYRRAEVRHAGSALGGFASSTDLAEFLKREKPLVMPRVRELREMGYLIASGRFSTTRYGKPENVWKFLDIPVPPPRLSWKAEVRSRCEELQEILTSILPNTLHQDAVRSCLSLVVEIEGITKWKGTTRAPQTP